MTEEIKVDRFTTDDGREVTSIRDVAADVIASRKPREQPVVQHRLTVLGTFYHQTSGGEARDFPMRYWRDLVNDEQVYERTTKIGTDPRPIDTGWLGAEGIRPGLVVVQNLSDAATLFVILSGATTRLRVPPGEFQALCPEDASQISLCASHPDTAFRVVAIPE